MYYHVLMVRWNASCLLLAMMLLPLDVAAAELFDDDGRHLGEKGHEFGATTGRPRRCGWLDAVALRRMVSLNGVSGFCVTKLDVMDGFEEIRVCTGYRLHGETLALAPLRELSRVRARAAPAAAQEPAARGGRAALAAGSAAADLCRRRAGGGGGSLAVRRLAGAARRAGLPSALGRPAGTRPGRDARE